jgi:rhodanese-related sulfurtransferase
MSILLCLQGLTPAAPVQKQAATVSVDFLVEHIDEVLVIDVRSVSEFAQGHILGALNARSATVAADAKTWAYRAGDRLIVTYCSCEAEQSSLAAAAALAKAGAKRVAALAGGYPAWVARGGRSAGTLVPAIEVSSNEAEPSADPAADRLFIGDWTGVVEIGGEALQLVLHVSLDPSGHLAATLDSPDQKVFKLVSNVTRVRNSLRWSIPKLDIEFRGELAGALIVGELTQRAVAVPLTLRK